MFATYFALLALVVSHASAWIPEVQKHILALDGTNLFSSNETTHGNLTSKRWLQASGKVRGVNLGSLFVFEPWLAETEWSNMGCGSYNSEFDCVSALGQSQANTVFQNHWNTWITQSDISQMQSYGLNTIRIPVGYWMMESLVYSDSEHFPQGGLAYLERVCGWASDAGFYIIIDLHGAPGAQVAQNADTGQYASSPGFYVDYQFDRATSFLSWLTTLIHSTNAFRNVGMISIVNEPVQNSGSIGTLLSSYYPNAYSAIRNAESAAGVSSNNYLHVETMNSLWGSGDPNQYMTNQYFMAYDDHRYIKWDSTVAVSQSAYLSDSCHNNRNSDNESPTIVGEFSLSVPDSVQWTSGWDPTDNKSFYSQWFAAQVLNYEKYTNGWVFWTWKSQLGDYRWSYQDAVAAGVIPNNPGNVNQNACSGI
ncbi:putative glucan endo-1,6-beta-glucosidase B [Lachnellula cervina]|uniref:glucan endo-1,6-beta-glucosidase n=1 Tax=Lachnellula cervina TaxID=1316786 RepID=A0A7D8UVB8_9HELO|nr:putative glucan endo-1,6-beta-glucosidase B [Lachnellula cervina]